MSKKITLALIAALGMSLHGVQAGTALDRLSRLSTPVTAKDIAQEQEITPAVNEPVHIAIQKLTTQPVVTKLVVAEEQPVVTTPVVAEVKKENGIGWKTKAYAIGTPQLVLATVADQNFNDGKIASTVISGAQDLCAKIVDYTSSIAWSSKLAQLQSFASLITSYVSYGYGLPAGVSAITLAIFMYKFSPQIKALAAKTWSHKGKICLSLVAIAIALYCYQYGLAMPECLSSWFSTQNATVQQAAQCEAAKASQYLMDWSTPAACGTAKTDLYFIERVYNAASNHLFSN